MGAGPEPGALWGFAFGFSLSRRHHDPGREYLEPPAAPLQRGATSKGRAKLQHATALLQHATAWAKKQLLAATRPGNRVHTFLGAGEARPAAVVAGGLSFLMFSTQSPDWSRESWIKDKPSGWGAWVTSYPENCCKLHSGAVFFVAGLAMYASRVEGFAGSWVLRFPGVQKLELAGCTSDHSDHSADPC